jgi:hypothetical protein
MRCAGWLWLWLAGCTIPPAGDSGACLVPAVTLDAVSGAPLELVHGPQGGWHVEVAGEAIGLGAQVSVAPVVTDVSSGQILAGDQPPVEVVVDRFDGCSGRFEGVRAYVDDVVPEGPYIDFVCGLAGRWLRLDVDVTDLLGEAIAAVSVEGIAARDPVDEAFCL